MRLTNDFVASAFLAAAQAAGLKKLFVLVGQVDHHDFVVTLTLPNPVATGEDDQVLVCSGCYEFEIADHVKRIAARKARLFAEAIPTIH